MALNTKVIDEKIRKLQMLRELLADPETASLLEAVTRNGNDNGTKATPVNGSSTIAHNPATPKRNSRGGQKLMVLQVLKTATAPVTTDWVVDRMQERGYVFKTSSPQTAVNEALRTLEGDTLAEVVKTVGVRNYWKATRTEGGLTFPPEEDSAVQSRTV